MPVMPTGEKLSMNDKLLTDEEISDIWHGYNTDEREYGL